MDSRELRNALGHYATGVTVVTTRGADGPVGVTVNSFASVSLDPPLVLWSLHRSSTSLQAFEAHGQWVINVLARDQEAISNRFAGPGPDDFSGLAAVDDEAGPVLQGTIATFWCTAEHIYDGGDHVILVGRVSRFATGEDAPPLLYFRGSYTGTQAK